MKDRGFINITREVRIKVESIGRNTGKIFYYIVSEANHKDEKYSVNKHEYIIKRGQVFISSTDVMRDLAWFDGKSKKTLTKKEVATGINALKKAGFIVTEKKIRGQIVTVNNYNKFQPLIKPKNTAGTDNETPRGNNVNGFDGFQKPAGTDKKKPLVPPFINEEKTTPDSYKNIYNTNNYSFSIAETEPYDFDEDLQDELKFSPSHHENERRCPQCGAMLINGSVCPSCSTVVEDYQHAGFKYQ